MAKKYYFCDELDEYCYSLNHFKEYLNNNEINEIKLYEAGIEYGTDYFFCSFYSEVGLKREGCGKDCKEYKPRNKVSGGCRYSVYCYNRTDKVFTLRKTINNKFELIYDKDRSNSEN